MFYVGLHLLALADWVEQEALPARGGYGSRFRVHGSGFTVYDFGLMAQDIGFRV